MKQLIVVDKKTGERLEDFEFSGGYNIFWSNNEDHGTIKKIRKLDNAKFGTNHWIKNMWYRPIAAKLAEKFEELKHIPVNKILFIEDMEWEKPDSLKPKRHWMARIKKVPKELYAMTGIEYILETRNYFIEQMSREQIIALIYHELRHIDQYGDLVPHDVEDWGNMVATLGMDWATTKGPVKDLLDEDFIVWRELEKVTKQLSIYDVPGSLKAVK